MEEVVKKFEFDLPRKAIREGTVEFGSDVNEGIFYADGYKIVIKGNEWRSDVRVFKDGVLVLDYTRTGDYVKFRKRLV